MGGPAIQMQENLKENDKTNEVDKYNCTAQLLAADYMCVRIWLGQAERVHLACC